MTILNHNSLCVQKWEETVPHLVQEWSSHVPVILCWKELYQPQRERHSVSFQMEFPEWGTLQIKAPTWSLGNHKESVPHIHLLTVILAFLHTGNIPRSHDSSRTHAVAAFVNLWIRKRIGVRVYTSHGTHFPSIGHQQFLWHFARGLALFHFSFHESFLGSISTQATMMLVLSQVLTSLFVVGGYFCIRWRLPRILQRFTVWKQKLFSQRNDNKEPQILFFHVQERWIGQNKKFLNYF